MFQTSKKTNLFTKTHNFHLCSNVLSFFPHNFSDDEQCMYIMFYMLRYTVIYKHRMFMFTSLALYIVRTLTTATKIANKISINFLYPTHIYLRKAQARRTHLLWIRSNSKFSFLFNIHLYEFAYLKPDSYNFLYV